MFHSLCCRRKRPKVIEQVTSAHKIREPTLENDPKQYHLSLDKDMFCNTAVLSLETPANMIGESVQRSTAAEMIINKGLDETCDSHTLSKIEYFFQFLHPVLLPSIDKKVLE